MSVTVTVLDPGALTTVQDLGRPGFAHLGVGRSGALDHAAARYANRLVGNPEDRAVLETTLTGVSFRADGPAVVAVTGAPAAVRVGGRPRAFAEPVTARAGEIVTIGPASSGVRSYVALAGGVDVLPVLGSRSSDTLSRLGPPALAHGTRLPIGHPAAAPRGADVPVVVRHPDSVRLTVLPGPRTDWFLEGTLDSLTARPYKVSAHADRVGLRLDGEPLRRSIRDELPSEGIVLGAVQVPASGRPVVFLNDHPTTGGYPVVAVLAAEAVEACAQLRPGSTVRFVL